MRSERVMKDQVTTLMEAVRQAQAVLANYVEPGPRNAEKTVSALLDKIKVQIVYASLRRAVKGRRMATAHVTIPCYGRHHEHCRRVSRKSWGVSPAVGEGEQSKGQRGLAPHSGIMVEAGPT